MFSETQFVGNHLLLCASVSYFKHILSLKPSPSTQAGAPNPFGRAKTQARSPAKSKPCAVASLLISFDKSSGRSISVSGTEGNLKDGPVLDHHIKAPLTCEGCIQYSVHAPFAAQQTCSCQPGSSTSHACSLDWITRC